jgi:L-rhamnose mutarotase
MKREAIKMRIKQGGAKKYKKGYNEIWLELVKVHPEAGISDYSIYPYEETNILFAFMKVKDHNTVIDLRNQPLIRKWWSNIEDIMAYNPA